MMVIICGVGSFRATFEGCSCTQFFNFSQQLVLFSRGVATKTLGVDMIWRTSAGRHCSSPCMSSANKWRKRLCFISWHVDEPLNVWNYHQHKPPAFDSSGSKPANPKRYWKLLNVTAWHQLVTDGWQMRVLTWPWTMDDMLFMTQMTAISIEWKERRNTRDTKQVVRTGVQPSINDLRHANVDVKAKTAIAKRLAVQIMNLDKIYETKCLTAATRNARSPTVTSHVGRTSRALVADEGRRWREDMSATRVSWSDRERGYTLQKTSPTWIWCTRQHVASAVRRATWRCAPSVEDWWLSWRRRNMFDGMPASVALQWSSRVNTGDTTRVSSGVGGRDRRTLRICRSAAKQPAPFAECRWCRYGHGSNPDWSKLKSVELPRSRTPNKFSLVHVFAGSLLDRIQLKTLSVHAETWAVRSLIPSSEQRLCTCVSSAKRCGWKTLQPLWYDITVICCDVLCVICILRLKRQGDELSWAFTL